MAETKTLVVVFADEDPAVVTAHPPEEFAVNLITLNPSDPVTKDGYFERDFGSSAPSGSVISYVKVRTPETAKDYQELARRAHNNYYRPCPTAVKASLSPCPVVLEIRVYPEGDCPKVSTLVDKGYMDFSIPVAAIPALDRAVISKSTLVSYKNTGLHYPTRLKLIVDGNRVLDPAKDTSNPITNWDSLSQPIRGLHIEPNQTEERVVSGPSDIGVCDTGRLAWFSRLGGLSVTEVKATLAALQKLPRWSDQKDHEVAEVSIRGREKPDFLEWLVGHYWLYCWHTLVEHWHKKGVPIDKDLPVPVATDFGAKVPIYRPAVQKLIELFLSVLRHSSSFAVERGIQLRLAFDTKSTAYQKMLRERKEAENSKLTLAIDKHTERFEVCFNVRLEILVYDTEAPEVLQKKKTDLAREEEEEEADILQQVGDFGGRVRSLRGTPGFNKKP
jgi:hypothetical protein